MPALSSWRVLPVGIELGKRLLLVRFEQAVCCGWFGDLRSSGRWLVRSISVPGHR